MPAPTDIDHRTPRRGPGLALALLGLLSPLCAQDGDGVDLSIAALHQAPRQHDHTIVQLRRFFDGRGGVVSVREELRVDADGTDTPPHALLFLGVEGELPGSPLTQRWAQTYGRYSGLYYRYGCFRIRDLARAQQNYTLHEFGITVRAGRVAHRLVLFPRRLDKAIWLLDVDAATFLPLYTAEYDASLQLHAEVEAVSLSTSVQLGASTQPMMVVTPQPTFVAAKAFMGNPMGLVEPPSPLTNDYTLKSVDVATNPLNNRQTLTLGYTDGIDQFFVIQSPGASNFFGSLPTATPSAATNTIARYRDASMTVLLFWDDGVGFQVTGRGALRRLDGIAKTVYAEALAN